jgi:C4-type Zn-finger protein
MTDATIFEVTDRPIPRPENWVVDCPSCGEGMPYLPTEGDSGEIKLDPAEWPVCACGCMFRPADVSLIETGEPR